MGFKVLTATVNKGGVDHRVPSSCRLSLDSEASGEELFPLQDRNSGLVTVVNKEAVFSLFTATLPGFCDHVIYKLKRNDFYFNLCDTCTQNIVVIAEKQNASHSETVTTPRRFDVLVDMHVAVMRPLHVFH